MWVSKPYCPPVNSTFSSGSSPIAPVLSQRRIAAPHLGRLVGYQGKIAAHHVAIGLAAEVHADDQHARQHLPHHVDDTGAHAALIGWKITNILAPDPLIAILDEVGVDPNAKSLVVNESGEPYTADGLRTMINRLCRELADEGKVKPGLNIHGLRHSLGNELYDLGIEREARKRMMAHESDAASLVHEQGGNRSRRLTRQQEGSTANIEASNERQRGSEEAIKRGSSLVG